MPQWRTCLKEQIDKVEHGKKWGLKNGVAIKSGDEYEDLKDYYYSHSDWSHDLWRSGM